MDCLDLEQKPISLGFAYTIRHSYTTGSNPGFLESLGISNRNPFPHGRTYGLSPIPSYLEQKTISLGFVCTIFFFSHLL